MWRSSSARDNTDLEHGEGEKPSLDALVAELVGVQPQDEHVGHEEAVRAAEGERLAEREHAAAIDAVAVQMQRLEPRERPVGARGRERLHAGRGDVVVAQVDRFELHKRAIGRRRRMLRMAWRAWRSASLVTAQVLTTTISSAPAAVACSRMTSDS